MPNNPFAHLVGAHFTAAERVATFDPAKAITHENMLRRFGVGYEPEVKG